MKSLRLVTGSGIFVGGAMLGLVIGHLGPSAVVRQTGQADVMQGYALLTEADAAMSHGETRAAQTWSAQGTAYLIAASYPLRHLGISRTSRVATYLQSAEYALLQGQATPHQKSVLQTFHKAFSPFAHQHYGSISDAAINKAFRQVSQTIAQ